jgi:hypothetical protein
MLTNNDVFLKLSEFHYKKNVPNERYWSTVFRQQESENIQYFSLVKLIVELLKGKGYV